MVLVADRRTEQRHKTVTQELIDGALVPMNFAKRQLEKAIQQRMHVLWTNTLGYSSGVGKIAEQDGDLFAFPFEGATRRQDFLGQVRRGVRKRFAFLSCGRRRDWFWSRLNWRCRLSWLCVTSPDEDSIILIHRQFFGINEFVFHRLKMVVIEIEPHLEGSVRNSVLSLEVCDYLGKHFVEGHWLTLRCMGFLSLT
jgi:hypothetical protein